VTLVRRVRPDEDGIDRFVNDITGDIGIASIVLKRRMTISSSHLEVKKLTSGGFWYGITNQLPDYMRSDEVSDGWYLAIQLRTGGVSSTRPTELPAILAQAAEDNGVSLRFALVDGRRKVSAS
jgi:hypothetical protein